jgi:hypothetical protein
MISNDHAAIYYEDDDVTILELSHPGVPIVVFNRHHRLPSKDQIAMMRRKIHEIWPGAHFNTRKQVVDDHWHRFIELKS